MKRGLDVAFVEQRAEDWQGTADRALCIGSSHTLGGSRAMLARLADIVPRERVLLGDMCWERTTCSCSFPLTTVPLSRRRTLTLTSALTLGTCKSTVAFNP
jgi:hypothetical protein